MKSLNSSIFPGSYASWKALLVYLGLLSGMGTILTHEAFAQQKLGLITSRACPYSCTTRGLPKNICRDWREGDTCYVEDLSKPADTPPPSGDPLGLELPIKPRRGYDQPSEGVVSPGQISGAAECEGLYRNELAPPRINVDASASGGTRLFDRMSVRGSIEGICIQEAGYFENGQKVSEISIQTSRQFRRFNFDVRFRRDRNPEIRAYNTAGDSDIFRISDGEHLK